MSTVQVFCKVIANRVGTKGGCDVLSVRSASQVWAEVGRLDGISDPEKSRRAVRGGSVVRGQNRWKTVENGSKGSKRAPDPPFGGKRGSVGRGVPTQNGQFPPRRASRGVSVVRGRPSRRRKKSQERVGLSGTQTLLSTSHPLLAHSTHWLTLPTHPLQVVAKQPELVIE